MTNELLGDYRDRLAGYSPEQRAQILVKIASAGWDIGCWLRPESTDLLFADPMVLADTAQALQEFDKTERPEFPDFRALHVPIDGEGRCWIIVSQQCDLLMDFPVEPFVELMPVTREAIDSSRMMQLWRGSSRLAPLTPVLDADGGGWVADLRVRAYMPKDRLVDYEARQALLENGSPHYVRDRFRRRLGDRSSRAAVPEQYTPLVRWLTKECKSGPGNDYIREWVLQSPSAVRKAKLHAIGLTQDRLDEVEFNGEDWTEALSSRMPPDIASLIHDEIGFAPADYFPVGTLDDAWSLDSLEHLSWRNPDASAPPLT